MQVGKKLYSAKKPAHPDDAHTKAKRFFKRKGRKRARQLVKKIMEDEE
jgi:hypothetical protein